MSEPDPETVAAFREAFDAADKIAASITDEAIEAAYEKLMKHVADDNIKKGLT